MKIPKTIQRFQAEHNIEVYPVPYKIQGIRLRRKGWDLCEPKKIEVIGSDALVQYIYFSFEPVNFSDGTKWFLRNVPRNYPDNAPRYFKRLSKNMLKGFDTWFRSFHCR